MWNSASGEQLDLGRVGIPRGEPRRRKARQVPVKARGHCLTLHLAELGEALNHLCHTYAQER